jgi:hypothetical protein
MPQLVEDRDYSPFGDGFYTLRTEHSVDTNIMVPEDIHFNYTTKAAMGNDNVKHITLTRDGQLIVYPEFKWNGANSCPDANFIMRASCFHDALYELLDVGLLNFHPHLKKADELLREVAIDDGCTEVAADVIYLAVRLFGPYVAQAKEAAAAEH